MKQPRRLFFAVSLMLGMSFLSSVLQLQGVLLTSVIDHYHLSDSAQGMASAAASAGSVVALIAAFLLIGRLKKTTLLRLALVLCGVCLVLLNLAPGFGLFVTLWLLMGVGTGIIDTSLSSCMADLYSGAMATRMLNALHMVYGLSSMLWPVICSRLMKGGLAWNRVYLCVAAFALIALTALTSAIALFGNQGRAVTADQRMPLKAMGGVLRKGAMLGLIAAIACHGMFLGGLATWINRYVSVTLGSDLGDRGA